MRCRARASSLRRYVLAGALVLALQSFGCGSEGDYYYIAEIKGEGDTLLLTFVFTCGLIDLTWDGVFHGLPNHYIELAVDHDALGGDCEEDPREVPFDVGPMKQSFRSQHPSPERLGLRIPPYEEEHRAICLSNLFQDEPFKGMRCK